MSKKFLFIIIALVFLALIAGFLVLRGKDLKVLLFDGKKTNNQIAEKQPFQVTGWLPYWKKTDGAAEFEKNISKFSEIHPFSFEVDADGNIKDTLKINNAPWPDLMEQAKENNVAVVPTILWADADAMHNVFSDGTLLNNHISAIADLLQQNNFSGVDIDYEGKNMEDRVSFSAFLEALHNKLSPAGKTLNCTVEARTQDNPPASWSGTRGMAYANDFSRLNQFCDSVTVMAYDQAFQANTEEIRGAYESAIEPPHAPNADSQWVEEVVNYSLRYIAPQKLVLGVPTYGWEFEMNKLPDGSYHYQRYQSVSYSKALDEAQAAGVTPARDSGGELSFTYPNSDGDDHIVTFSDAESVRQKIELAKKYNLRGASLFKIDGQTDPGIFNVL